MNSLFSITNKYFLAAALCTGCCFVCGCENDEGVIKELTEKKVMVEEGRNIESYLSQQGSTKARLKSPLMLRVLNDTAPYIEFPKTLHVDFYNDSTKIETWLDCLYGKYYEKLDKVFLRDSVVVVNINGDTLRAPELWWDQNTKLFYTDSVAEYHKKDQHVYGGKGMVATQDMTEVTFKEPGGSKFKVTKDGTLQK